MKKKEIKYYSSDKLYNVPKIKIMKKKGFIILLVIGLFVLLLSLTLLVRSLDFSDKLVNVSYNEIGSADFTVHLKENDFYDRKYLDSGMKYVASLISSVDPKFNYEIHVNKNMDFKYKYSIDGTLVISDVNNNDKVLFTKDYNLLHEKSKNIKSNNLVINEDLNIDYDEYNDYVNKYKKEYGLQVDAKLLVKLNVNVEADYKNAKTLDKTNSLEIEIPLSEQTVDININTDKINNKDYLTATSKSLIKDKILFVISTLLFIMSVGYLAFITYLYIKYRRKNIYNITVKKILRDYDRLIVNGKVDIKEADYKNKVYPDSIEELVDAAESLNTDILFYEVIPNEKCFFVIIHDDTLYKFRLTKAYLEKKELESLYEEEKKKQNKKK